jgi:O-antigen/teichoic acid export membrane protein
VAPETQTDTLTPDAGDQAAIAPPGLASGLGRVRADGTMTMLAGTLLAGFAAYAWQAAGTRSLGNSAFAPVATLWTLNYLVTTVLLAPIEQYATRTLSSGRDGRSHLAEAIPAIAGILGVATVLLGVGCLLVRGRFFHGEVGYAVIGALLVTCFGCLSFIRGSLAGERDFSRYGRLTGLDGVTRLVVGATILVAGGTALDFAWSIPLCALTSLVWVARVPRLSDRGPVHSDVHVPIRRFMLTMVGGTAAAQLLLAGGPLLLGLLGAPASAVTILFVAQTAGRAVLLVALPLWSRALPGLTAVALRREHENLSRIAERILVISVAGALVGALFAAAVGPPALAALFGHGSRPDAFVAGAVGAGTVMAVGNLGLNQLLVAAGRTSRITICWWTALVAATLWIALGPGSALHRVDAAFVIGEALALVLLTVATSTARAPRFLRRAVHRRRARRSR